MTITDISGETTQRVDPEITFESLCNKIGNEIENWEEDYTLTEEIEKIEISSAQDFRNVLETAQKQQKVNVMLVLKPKYEFIICDETDSKENTFSLMYFGQSKTTFENVYKLISVNCSNLCDNKSLTNERWQDNYDLVYQNINGNNYYVKDDMSFDAMIRNMKSTGKNDILLYFKRKVSGFYHVLFVTFCFCVVMFRLVFFDCIRKNSH